MKIALLVFGMLIIGIIVGYAVAPLFNTKEVNDELPKEIVTEPEASFGDEDSMPDSISLDHLSDETKRDMMLGLIDANKEEKPTMDDVLPDTDVPANVPQVATSFRVVDTPLHPAEGKVRVLATEEGTIVRFEDFMTINGPNVHVYLAKDLDATEFIDLGPIRGTSGNINYAVPEGVAISEYRYVMHWCVPFGVLFNYADLQG